MRVTKTQSAVAALSIVPSVVAPSAAPVIVAPVVEVPAKKAPRVKISAAERAVVEENEKFGNIGDTLQELGSEIGHYMVDKELAQESLLDVVSALLLRAMEQGLTVDMLKAPSKSNPGECFIAIVDGINAARIGAGKGELATGARDNYMTRIRAFVRDRGANPLDLFGNLAVKAAKTRTPRQPSAPSEPSDDTLQRETESTPSPDSVSGKDGSLFGLVPLNAFLIQWLDANPAGTIKTKIDYIGMVEDLRKALAKEFAS